MSSLPGYLRAVLMALAACLAAILAGVLPPSSGMAASAMQSAAAPSFDFIGDDDDRGDSGREDDDDRPDRGRGRDDDDRRDKAGDNGDDDDDDDKDKKKDKDDGDKKDKDDGDKKDKGVDKTKGSDEPARLPSAVVSPPPPPPAPAATPRAPDSFAAVVRIRGRVTRRGARLTLLGVRAPNGARVVARCVAGPCPIRQQAVRARSPVTLRRFHRHFRAGTVLVVRVTMPGRIGKFTRFTIRRGKPPLRRDLCLPPGARRPARCT